MNDYKFQIAGALIQVQADFSIQMAPNYQPFLVDTRKPADHCITLHTVDFLPEAEDKSVWIRGRVQGTYHGQPCILHSDAARYRPCLMEIHPAENQTVCLFPDENKPLDVGVLFNHIGLESVLWHFDTMILHSSLIRWQGKAILFSAPCGTGKSTQADLWQKYQGADILNGDRSGLRKIDGQWIAHGLPYAGTSGIYRQEKATIAAIVLLEQAPENTIVPMNPAQALRRIWPEVSLHRWDRDFTEKGLALLTDLVTAVPFYKLSCRPDEGAVNLLRDTLNREVKP